MTSVDGTAAPCNPPGDHAGASGVPSLDSQDGTLDAAGILASLGHVPYAWRRDTDSLLWGTNAAEVLSVADPALIASGYAYRMLLDPVGRPARFDTIVASPHQDAGAGVPYRLRYAVRLPVSARQLWLEDTGRWFAGPDGQPARAHGVVRVIEEPGAHDDPAAMPGPIDGSPGEVTRRDLLDLLGSTVDAAVRSRSSCGFLLVAIDNLARLNEAYGCGIGDEVIAAVAGRLRRTLRGADTLGRYAGNKFAVVLKTCTGDDLEIAAGRLLTAVRDEVVRTASGPVAVTATIGGVTAPRHARTVPDIVARAQDALAEAKAKRHGSFAAYRPSPERDALRRQSVQVTDDILSALNERRIALAFEPVVETMSRRPAFYECLLRVHRADGTPLPTHSLVAMSERLGLVRLLDHRVVELAIAELIAAPELRASFNVSPASTVDPDWWAALVALLRAHAGVAERLTVEITETAAIHDVDDTRGFVARVKDLGCRIAIDDFGAGYTSFRNLRRLGVDIVKIDGAFVQNLTGSQDDRAFVRTLLDLAQRLQLVTVAEWVQDEEAAALLADWGCGYLQGALVGLATAERAWGVAPPTGAHSA